MKSILWNNEPNEIGISVDGTVSLDYTDIQGGQDSIFNNNGTITWGIGNIDADPLLCEPDSGN